MLMPTKRSHRLRWLIGLVLTVLVIGWSQPSVQASSPDSIDFFEQRIRPVLIEHCYACHASDTEQQGGLTLDTKSGWQIGGDSGPAIVPGDAAASRLIRVMSYQDPELEMPPDSKLPQNILDDFKRWIDAGAVDPRDDAPGTVAKKRDSEIDWDKARQHWAYRPIQPVSPPSIGEQQLQASDGWPRGVIDQFVYRTLRSHNFSPNATADRFSLIRRLSIDLTGLPPDPDLVRQYASAEDEALAYEQLVDRMIASHDFAERFARHWLDVARYAESVTLRGLVQPEVWRYRDYVIDAIHQDRSWKDIFREQIAGDLIAFDSVESAQRAQAAVTFLCMGNMNLENQQKRLLEMDFIDEQLDTIGRAMLGQTIGCARCHDHKFDPIPTADYYAMAGVLHGSVGIEHSNVSRWVEVPLPMTPAEQIHWDAVKSELDATSAELAAIKKQSPPGGSPKVKVVASSKLPGIVIDDRDAKRVGQWKESEHTQPYVDGGYIHDLNEMRGDKTLTFEPVDLPPGQYDVRVAYCAAANRTSKAEFTVFSADGETTVTINQRKPGSIDGLWESLGTFRFEPAGQALVMLSNVGADGHVIGDAVQFLPLRPSKASLDQDGRQADSQDPVGKTDSEQEAQAKRLELRTKQLTVRQSELQRQLNQRPKAMGLLPRKEAGNLPIHIRGSIHNLGQPVERGVLQIINDQLPPLEITGDSCGRLELADWIANDHNPLTSRVLVNRIWLWVMGQGLVRTPDNFGTTGQKPTHPELLDWLTDQFIENGWSMKHLVKQIVLSATYRQSARLPSNDDTRLQADPDNRLWWRSDRKPLTAEALRDSVLSISGELDSTPYGSRIRGNITADYGYKHDELIRSIYMPVFRNAIPELLETFNYTDTSFVTGQRQRGIVAQQALAIMNHPWFVDRALSAAKKNIERDVRDDSTDVTDQLDARVDYAFLQTLSRYPDDAERKAAYDFLADTYQTIATKSLTAETLDEKALIKSLAQLYHGLFATAEFRQLE